MEGTPARFAMLISMRRESRPVPAILLEVDGGRHAQGNGDGGRQRDDEHAAHERRVDSGSAARREGSWSGTATTDGRRRRR